MKKHVPWRNSNRLVGKSWGHSSRSDIWGTPPDIIERVRRVLGTIDLDPASSAWANETVKATRFFTKNDDGLSREWWGSVYCNPPGGVSCSFGPSMCGLFWEKLIEEIRAERVKSAVFMAFSVGALQHTQRYEPCILDFMFCIPAKRIRFLDPSAAGRAAPSHSNAIVYVPGTVNNGDLFIEEFRSLGKIAFPGVQARSAEALREHLGFSPIKRKFQDQILVDNTDDLPSDEIL